MGPTPGSWSQNLLGWGLGTCLLNRYCKHRNCSQRTTARSPVNPDSLALSSPHPSCLLSHHEHSPFRGPRCPNSLGTAMSICDSYLLSQLQEEQKIKPHMTAPPSWSTFRACARHLQEAPPVLGLLASCPPTLPPLPRGPGPRLLEQRQPLLPPGLCTCPCCHPGAPPVTLLLRFLLSESSSAVLGFLHAL